MFNFLSKIRITSPMCMSKTENITHPESADDMVNVVDNEVSKGPFAFYQTSYGQLAT
jgi:hypothetical protein